MNDEIVERLNEETERTLAEFDQTTRPFETALLKWLEWNRGHPLASEAIIALETGPSAQARVLEKIGKEMKDD